MKCQRAFPVETSIAIADEAPASRETLDLESVPRRTWTPSYERLPALQDRGGAVEQFRSLRSRIFELRDISPLKSILVTSGLPQEGKSFIATNLAISLARHKNSKVLLIDGDMRRYTLHQLLGLRLASRAGRLSCRQGDHPGGDATCRGSPRSRQSSPDDSA